MTRNIGCRIEYFMPILPTAFSFQRVFPAKEASYEDELNIHRLHLYIHVLQDKYLDVDLGKEI